MITKPKSGVDLITDTLIFFKKYWWEIFMAAIGVVLVSILACLMWNLIQIDRVAREISDISVDEDETETHFTFSYSDVWEEIKRMPTEKEVWEELDNKLSQSTAISQTGMAKPYLHPIPTPDDKIFHSWGHGYCDDGRICRKKYSYFYNKDGRQRLHEGYKDQDYGSEEMAKRDLESFLRDRAEEEYAERKRKQ